MTPSKPDAACSLSNRSQNIHPSEAEAPQPKHKNTQALKHNFYPISVQGGTGMAHHYFAQQTIFFLTPAGNQAKHMNWRQICGVTGYRSAFSPQHQFFTGNQCFGTALHRGVMSLQHIIPPARSVVKAAGCLWSAQIRCFFPERGLRSSLQRSVAKDQTLKHP